MPRTMPQRLPGMEVKRVDDDAPLQSAKARVGRAVRVAIGENCLKTYGDEGLLSKVVTGERVPAYLARIYQDVHARRRLGLALLKGDPRVRVRLVIEVIDDDEPCQEIS